MRAMRAWTTSLPVAVTWTALMVAGCKFEPRGAGVDAKQDQVSQRGMSERDGGNRSADTAGSGEPSDAAEPARDAEMSPGGPVLVMDASETRDASTGSSPDTRSCAGTCSGVAADGCCPVGCTRSSDVDCTAVCGNGVVEPGETCDPVAQCMVNLSTCQSDRDTIRMGGGDPAMCSFVCAEAKRPCGTANQACPSGCAAAADPDCRKGAGEVCSTSAECVSQSCVDRVCCTQNCNGCQRCVGPGGTCQDIERGDPKPNFCSVPANGRAICLNGRCDFSCLNGKVRCGNACFDCCQDNDCKVGENEEATCNADHRCDLRCQQQTTRCRGTCRAVVVLGACVAASGAPPRDVSWCDAPQIQPGDFVLEGDKFRMDVLDSRRPDFQFLEPTRPNRIDELCFNFSDDITLAYCALGPLSAARSSRRDTVQMSAVRFGEDETISQVQNTPNTRIRTCGEPLPP